MNRSSIIEALKTLDPKDDNHWTTDGMPRLDVLQATFPGITRALITGVAPVFSRKKPNLPDLDALREQAEKAALDAEEAAREAEDKARVAKKTAETVQKLDEPIHDAHALTRANRGWLKSQIEEDNKRALRQAALDNVLKQAGGIDQIGQHPVERAIAQRVIAARKNVVIPAKKKDEQANG